MLGIGSLRRVLWDAPPSAFAETRRYYVMDLFRGLAALVILIWHYHNFYWVLPDTTFFFDRSQQPFYNVFGFFYDYGLHAVAFFWMLSGFVLSCAYGAKRTSAYRFAVNRFARLYPLHFITLLVAALVSFICVSIIGRPTAPNNDIYHFVLNLFFASFWGFQNGMSFNAPIWSVSVEVAIYALFWCTLPALFRRGLLPPLAAAALSVIWYYFGAQTFLTPLYFFSKCAMFFYFGVAVFALHRAVSNAALQYVAGLVLAAIGAWVVTAKAPAVQTFDYSLAVLLAGLLLILAALEATVAREWARSIRWVGDNTYSTYLWHQPLVHLTGALLFVSGFGRELFNSPMFFVGYIAIMTLIGRASFVFIERPARGFLRQKLAPTDRTIAQGD